MKTLLGVVVQVDETVSLSEERFIVQYVEDDTNKQVIKNYADLSVEDKATYDAYKAICATLMNEAV